MADFLHEETLYHLYLLLDDLNQVANFEPGDSETFLRTAEEIVRLNEFLAFWME